MLALVSLAAATTLWVTGSGAAQSSAATHWQTLPVKLRSYPPWIEPIWVSGRVWFLVHRETGQSSFVSALVRGGGLSSFVTSPIPNTGNWNLVGSSVVYNPPAPGGHSGTARIVALLPSGKVGAPQPISGDPQQAVLAAFPKWQAAEVVAGVRIGARTVWVLSGGERTSGLRVKATLAVCCGEGGEVRDLTPMITNRLYGTSAWNIGVDGRGSLWVAWADSKQNPSRDPRLSAHMVELDPTALAPRSSKVLPTTTGDRRGLLLVCAASCRVVTWPLTGVFTWAAGDGPPAKISGAAMKVMSAGYRSGRLAISYYVTAPSGYVARTAVALGDARGRHLRDRRSSRPPGVSLPFFPSSIPLAVSIPAGAVVVQGYDTQQGRARALVAFLPLTR